MVTKRRSKEGKKKKEIKVVLLGKLLLLEVMK